MSPQQQIIVNKKFIIIKFLSKSGVVFEKLTREWYSVFIIYKN